MDVVSVFPPLRSRTALWKRHPPHIVSERASAVISSFPSESVRPPVGADSFSVDREVSRVLSPALFLDKWEAEERFGAR